MLVFAERSALEVSPTFSSAGGTEYTIPRVMVNSITTGLRSPITCTRLYRPKSPNYFFPVISLDNVVDDESTKGWYWGDTAGLMHYRLLLTGGFRRTTMRGNETLRGNSSASSQFHESRFTPSAAGLFKLTSRVSIYGNFIQALEPGWIAPPDTKNAGQIFPPMVSNQFEVGAKAQFRS